MISYQNVLDSVKTQPFQPFRIQMVSGAIFDIRHPEMIKVSRRYVLVFSSEDNSSEVIDRFQTVSLSLVESISHIGAAVV